MGFSINELEKKLNNSILMTGIIIMKIIQLLKK